MKPITIAAASVCLGFALPATADIQPHGGMLRYPDVSRTHIVFSYANDLWLVPRDGGAASPLASPPGQESIPQVQRRRRDHRLRRQL